MVGAIRHGIQGIGAGQIVSGKTKSPGIAICSCKDLVDMEGLDRFFGQRPYQGLAVRLEHASKQDDLDVVMILDIAGQIHGVRDNRNILPDLRQLVCEQGAGGSGFYDQRLAILNVSSGFAGDSLLGLIVQGHPVIDVAGIIGHGIAALPLQKPALRQIIQILTHGYLRSLEKFGKRIDFCFSVLHYIV